MKKLLSISIILLASANLFAQTVVNDSVTMGAGYANQIWYSMSGGEVSQSPNNNWDLAFTTYFMGAAAYSNTAQGVKVFMVPNTDTLGFAVVDSTGYSTWEEMKNADTSWSRGAFNYNMTSHPNYGWGMYDQVITHEVVGDSLFLIRMGTAGSYTFKKLWLKKKTVQGNWIFRYANLDNSGDVTDTILMSDYAGKNFSYYSLMNGTELNREPLTTNWDITFTRYETYSPAVGCIPGVGYFNVTGVLHNEKVVTAQADGVDFSTVDFASYQSQLDSNISVIGYDWKCSGVITADRVYFIKANTAIWKIQFTGYDFNIGKIVFSKSEVSNTSAISAADNSGNSISIYPNPSTGNSSLIVDAKKSGTASFNIYNTVGEMIATEVVTLRSGLNVVPLNTNEIADGIYFVRNMSDKNSGTLKLVIAR